MRNPSVARRSALCATLVLALALAIAPAPTHACPPPPTLSELIERADVLVVGAVVGHEIKTLKIDQGEGEEAYEYQVPVADLRIETVVKGSLEPDRIVRFDASHFVDTENPDETPSKVLVFGSFDEESKGYECFAFRNVSSDDARASYVAKVRDYLAIAPLTDRVERRSRHTEWAIRCVEDPKTRYDGVRDLQSVQWQYLDDEEGPAKLDASQRERLVRVLLASPNFADYATYEIAELIQEDRNMQVLTVFQDELARLAEAPAPHAAQIMQVIGTYLDWRTGTLLSHTYPYDGDVAAQKTAIARFLDLMSRLEEIPEAIEPETGDIAEAEQEAIWEAEQAETEAVEAIEEFASGAVDDYTTRATGEEPEPETDDEP